MDVIINPPLPISIEEFYKTLLSVSGVLFGIAFAAMLFVLQSGFSSFKFSRRMFLELYLHFGRQLLYSLAYLTAAPFLVLFFPGSTTAVSWLYGLYFIFFLNATLDYAKEEGYILTIHSTKYVPRHYGRIRTYFRYIANRGALRNIFFLLPAVLLITYPYFVSLINAGSLYLTKVAVFYSCLIPLLNTLYKITKFIPEFFVYTGMEMSASSQEASEERSEEEKQQNIVEKRALKEHLINHGLDELNPTTPRKFIDGDISVNFLDKNDNGEAWFNIDVEISNVTPEQVRSNVLSYAHTLAKRLHESKVSINSFVLSFHIKIGKQPSRNMFFRISRNELERVYSHGRDQPEDMARLKNVLFDELFRE
ncbi:hypothetical protein [Plesiomonas shigelloides]|uniref:hypothetical protein n=1 Tax=Plesiomonas shigelloides TaxID=703 RepID=UPI001261840E|nr:hypothetical protein [Plesiomonas shigelloides]KAB7694570.1 hypothetical protein GBN15_15045 [Plesiomonas shigelloides]